MYYCTDIQGVQIYMNRSCAEKAPLNNLHFACDVFLKHHCGSVGPMFHIHVYLITLYYIYDIITGTKPGIKT